MRSTGGSRKSGWIADRLAPGAAVDIHGPNGSCYYLPGDAAQPLLLISNGTGLAPLYGIVRDALHSGHQGAIHLYHGSRHPTGLNLHAALDDLARRHANFTYVGCLSGAVVPDGCRAGRAEACAFADHPDLSARGSISAAIRRWCTRRRRPPTSPAPRLATSTPIPSSCASYGARRATEAAA